MGKLSVAMMRVDAAIRLKGLALYCIRLSIQNVINCGFDTFVSSLFLEGFTYSKPGLLHSN